MDFKEFLPEEGEIKENENVVEEVEKVEKIGQNQLYDVITSRKPDWQTIIYDLIHTEQLDPWDVDIVVLTGKYFEKIIEIEEQENIDDSDYEEPDFYVSSKILLAASLLLRIKSEFLLNKHLKSIDEVLFGRKEESKPIVERIEIDEDDLPILIPKTPLPRARRVTLPELMAALNKAINTESRRIKREVAIKRAKKLSEVDIPKFRRIDLKDRIKQFYAKILTSLRRRPSSEKHMNKVGYSNLIGKEKTQRLACFLPLLHLSNSKKLWLEQEEHLEEIWVFLYEYFDKNRDNFLDELEEDIEEMKEELAENVDEVKSERIEQMRMKRELKKMLKEEARKELEEELQEINKDIKLDNITGFDDSEI